MNTMNGMNTMDTMNHWIIPANKQNRCSVCKANARRACEKCDVYLQENVSRHFILNNIVRLIILTHTDHN